MAKVDTDRDWEYFAARDPYWAVLTNDCFRKENLSATALQEFDKQGEQHVAFVMQTIKERVAPRFEATSCLDFGCGVGRLVFPFARRGLKVVGVDVAESMLAEARRRCAELNLANVEFVKGDDALSRVSGTFDLVHSFIVFQHIPCARGHALLDELYRRLTPNGVGVVHFTYDTSMRVPPRGPLRATLSFVKRNARRALHRLRGTARVEPPVMQMNSYDVNALLRQLHEKGVRRMWLEGTEDDGEKGVIFFFRKPREG